MHPHRPGPGRRRRVRGERAADEGRCGPIVCRGTAPPRKNVTTVRSCPPSRIGEFAHHCTRAVCGRRMASHPERVLRRVPSRFGKRSTPSVPARGRCAAHASPERPEPRNTPAKSHPGFPIHAVAYGGHRLGSSVGVDRWALEARRRRFVEIAPSRARWDPWFASPRERGIRGRHGVSPESPPASRVPIDRRPRGACVGAQTEPLDRCRPPSYLIAEINNGETFARRRIAEHCPARHRLDRISQH
jgi:hypothetical protein